MKTAEQIDQEYTDLCTELGDLEIQKGMLEHKKNEVIRKIAQLSREKLDLAQAEGTQQ